MEDKGVKPFAVKVGSPPATSSIPRFNELIKKPLGRQTCEAFLFMLPIEQHCFDIFSLQLPNPFQRI